MQFKNSSSVVPSSIPIFSFKRSFLRLIEFLLMPINVRQTLDAHVYFDQTTEVDILFG
mgnify:CR=1 FL=1